MEKLLEQFKAQFGHPAEVIASAPGRLEILGNHTDYNQGFVLSCAVDCAATFAVGRASGATCRLKDFRVNSEKSFSIQDIGAAKPKDWSNYIKGVVLQLRKRGFEVPAFDAALISSVPLSAGMSSSAALETAMVFALCQLCGFLIDKAELARIGQGVENEYLGLKSGLLDQFSSIFGRKNSLILSDFRTVEVLGTVEVPSDYVFAVINSMVKHNLVDSEYNTRRENCESAAAKLAAVYPGAKTLRDITPEQLEKAKDKLTLEEYRRAAHVVGECDRVLRGVELLKKGDIAGFGELLFTSHESSRVNFENSTPELDYLVELAKSVPGCAGARLSGGGFGGISIHLVEATQAEEYGKRVAAAFKLRTGVEPEVLLCGLGDGAFAAPTSC